MYTIAGLLLAFTLGHAAEVATPVSGTTGAGRNRAQAVCDQIYREKGCSQFFQAHPTLAEYAINCNDPIDPAREIGKCGGGAVNAVKDIAHAFVDIPVAMAAQLKPTESERREMAFYTECVKSQACKVGAIKAVAGPDLSPDLLTRLEKVNDPRLLRAAIDGRARVLRTEQFKRTRELLLQNASPERDAELDRLVPSWRERQNAKAESLWAAGASAVKFVDHVDACFNRDVQIEAVCYGLSSIVAPAGVLKGGSKLYKIAKAMGAAKAVETGEQAVLAAGVAAERPLQSSVAKADPSPASVQLAAAPEVAASAPAPPVARVPETTPPPVAKAPSSFDDIPQVTKPVDVLDLPRGHHIADHVFEGKFEIASNADKPALVKDPNVTNALFAKARLNDSTSVASRETMNGGLRAIESNKARLVKTGEPRISADGGVEIAEFYETGSGADLRRFRLVRCGEPCTIPDLKPNGISTFVAECGPDVLSIPKLSQTNATGKGMKLNVCK